MSALERWQQFAADCATIAAEARPWTVQGKLTRAAGLVLEAVLKSAGWPTDSDKIRAAMEQVKVDTKGLRGGPIEWSKDNHFRARQFYRVYRWDPAKSAVVLVKDWAGYDVKNP